MPHRVRVRSARAASLLCLALLSACAGHHGRVASRRAAPGDGADPWGPYIHEASGRFSVPEQWIRAVMQQESGGHQFIDGQQTTSAAGAMGLMQVVPDTYAGLRDRYGLGGDPYDPHDNIMAGTAYIREMYDRFGAPGFLAAYNAGPRRLDSYLNDGSPLPSETVNYLASVAPRLGPDTPLTGPLAAYAGRRATQYAAASPPRSPTPVSEAEVVPDPVPEPVQVAFAAPPPVRASPEHEAPATVSSLGIAAPRPLPGAAPRAATSGGTPPTLPRFVPAPFVAPPVLRASASAPGAPARSEQGSWAIQVGAFTTPALARDAADAARERLAGRGETTVGPAARPGGGVLFRARVTGLSAETARAGCARVAATGGACLIVSPENS